MTENIIGAILTIIGIPLLIYIFWKVRKMEKERKKDREELRKLYEKGDEKIKKFAPHKLGGKNE